MKLVSTNKHNFLVIITGPTAVGKTDLTLEIAEKYNSSIFSADSRQIYKEMNIGTAKISVEEMRGIRHHFIDHISILDEYSAGKYERDFDALVQTYYKSNTIGIVTGGTGLYLKAILEGLDSFPEVPKEVTDQLNERLQTEGLSTLASELKKKDPEYAATVDLQNSRRVLRALAVCQSSSKPYSYFLKKRKPKTNPFEIIGICLTRPREELYERINRRVDLMMQNGLRQEVERLLPFRNLKSLQTVGYQELFRHLEGELTLEEAVELIKRNTRRYAKRQMTWFKNQGNWKLLEAENKIEIFRYIDEVISSNGKPQK